MMRKQKNMPAQFNRDACMEMWGLIKPDTTKTSGLSGDGRLVFATVSETHTKSTECFDLLQRHPEVIIQEK